MSFNDYYHNIIMLLKCGNFPGKIPWKISEIFRKNMKFSGQFFRLTTLSETHPYKP